MALVKQCVVYVPEPEKLAQYGSVRVFLKPRLASKVVDFADLESIFGYVAKLDAQKQTFRLSPFANKTLQTLLPIGWTVDARRGIVKGTFSTRGYAGLNAYRDEWVYDEGITMRHGFGSG